MLLRNNLIIEYAPLDPNIDWRHSLNIAASMVCKEMVQVLLDGGADIDKGDGHGVTPLQYAAGWGIQKLSKLILVRKMCWDLRV